MYEKVVPIRFILELIIPSVISVSLCFTIKIQSIIIFVLVFSSSHFLVGIWAHISAWRLYKQLKMKSVAVRGRRRTLGDKEKFPAGRLGSTYVWLTLLHIPIRIYLVKLANSCEASMSLALHVLLHLSAITEILLQLVTATIFLRAWDSLQSSNGTKNSGRPLNPRMHYRIELP